MEDRIHKALPDDTETHCCVCGQRIRRVPGGHGPTWVHSDSGAVAAPTPAALRSLDIEHRMQQAIVLAFEGEAEAWTLSTDSGDRLASIAAQAAARLVLGADSWNDGVFGAGTVERE